MEQTAKEATTLEQKLPLVLEVIPGQAAEGLINIYQPGSYEGHELQDLVYQTIRMDHSVEDSRIADDISNQLNGGKLLYQGAEIGANPLEHAVLEKTAKGESYHYVQIRAIKPQEGGYQ